CVLFELVTGRRPFEDESRIKSLHKLVYESPVSINELNPSAPPELQRIVRRCLAKDPDDRYQTIKDVAIELRELRIEMNSGGSVDSALPSSPSAASPLVTQPMTRHDSESSLEMQTRILPSAAPSIEGSVASPTSLSAASI